MTNRLEISPTSVIAAACQPAACRQAEVLAGYTLLERLGAGGYGEVWSATGPGGLRKAVKILHGRYDGPHADAELKALECVRELRHPFLLNIERAEVVDGRLIIVTELADRSLDECFNAARRDGERGIAREALLDYLQDAAEALDFMYERHGMAHLDIKPENLFLQGDHLKVGDLGLVKDLKRSNLSLMGGFTALYAAPELFDGKPGAYSDQYSLAIVYQVMLTGTAPFAGRTPAQLAAQHLGHAPDLSPLGPADRPAMARALAKNPEARFSGCRQFVDELSRRRTRVRQSARGPASPTAPDAGTSFSGDSTAAPLARISTAPVVPLPLANSVPLPPPPAGTVEVSRRPAIVIGLGGLGVRVLHELRHRLTERFEGDRGLPAFRLLAIDTDVRSACSSAPDRDRPRAPQVEALPIPLRDSNDYRTASRELLGWLSRRWLFNIPRSRQVEGVRPLGRLALVDHQEAVRSKLRQLIRETVTDESRQATNETTGLTLSEGPPDVVVVASISGGTGAGSVLDLGYLVRGLFTEMGLSPGSIHGILLHGTGGAAKSRDLQTANAMSCLEELRHFMTPGLGYPGDRATRLPSSTAAPFDHTYVLALGEGLEDSDFDRECAVVAEYLHTGMTTKAGQCLSAWRQLERTQPRSAGDDPAIRTFSASIVEQPPLSEMTATALVLCRALVRKWCRDTAPSAEGAPARTPYAIEAAKSLLAPMETTEQQLAQKMAAVLPGNDGNALSACFANWPRLSQPVADGQTALDSLVRVIGAGQPPRSIPSDEKSAPALSHAARLAGDHLRLAARKSATAIRDAILALLDAPGDGLAAACECAGDALWRVNALAAEWTQVLKNVQTERQRASREFRVVAAPPDGPRNQTPDSSKETNRSRSGQELLLGFLDEAFRSNMEYLDHVRRALAGGGDVLVRIRERLGQLGSAFGAGSTESAGDEPSLSVDVEQLERRIRDAGEFKVSALLDNDCALPALADALRRGALEFLAVRASLAAMEAAHGPKASPPSPGGQSSMATRLENLGGGRRLLALLPDEDSAARWKEKLTESFGDCVAVGSSERGPLFLLIELEDVLLERMLGRLTHRHPHLVEVASRLHTRVDIDW